MATKEPVEVPLLDALPSPTFEEDTTPKRVTPIRGPKISENAKSAASIPYKPGKLVAPLTEMYTFLGMGCMMFDTDISTAILENAEPCAQALDKLAEKNPAVRKLLYALVETSAWGLVISAHLPILLALGARFVPQVRDIKDMMSMSAQMKAENFAA